MSSYEKAKKELIKKRHALLQKSAMMYTVLIVNHHMLQKTMLTWALCFCCWCQKTLAAHSLYLDTA